ncbi:uncharacterized protein [Rhodnius prolixus]|uniref:uncharacterized protein n=1 Tax=Rhodnius prolixus TaxID=13249 RepID=UPI003D18E84A
MHLFGYILVGLAVVDLVLSIQEIKGLNKKEIQELELRSLEECRVEYNVDKSEVQNYLDMDKVIPDNDGFKKVLGCYAGKMTFVDDTRINWDKVRLAAEIYHENEKEYRDKSLKLIDECEKKSYEGLSHNEVSYVVAKCIKDGYVQRGIKW